MKSSRLFCALALTLVFSLTGFNSFAQQPPANGASYSQEEAAKYLQDDWGSKEKLRYFSVDAAAHENIKTIFKNQPNTDHVSMKLGVIGDKNYLFSISVNAEGKLLGDYYVSEMPNGQPVGPCPRNCD